MCTTNGQSQIQIHDLEVDLGLLMEWYIIVLIVVSAQVISRRTFGKKLVGLLRGIGVPIMK